MNVITIPRRVVQEDDLVVIPRKEYEALLSFKKIQEFEPTAMQKKALVRAESNFKHKKALSYNELIRKLGFEDRP